MLKLTKSNPQHVRELIEGFVLISLLWVWMEMEFAFAL